MSRIPISQTMAGTGLTRTLRTPLLRAETPGVQYKTGLSLPASTTRV